MRESARIAKQDRRACNPSRNPAAGTLIKIAETEACVVPFHAEMRGAPVGQVWGTKLSPWVTCTPRVADAWLQFRQDCLQPRARVINPFVGYRFVDGA